MGWTIRLLLATGFLTLSLIAAVWLGKDSAWFRELAQRQASQILQREVTIGDLEIQLGSSLQVSVANLVIAQPDGIDGPPFVRLASGQLRSQFNDLLATPPRIKLLSLTGLKLTALQGQETSSWQFGSKKEKANAGSTSKPNAIPILLEEADISDLKIDWIDGKGQSRHLQADATLGTDSAATTLRLDGRLNDARLDAELRAFPTEAVMALENVNLAVELNLDEVNLSGETFIGNLLAPERPRVNLSLQGPSIEYLTDRLNMAPISSGPMELEITALPTSDRMMFGVNGLFGDFSVVLNGDADNLRTLDQADMAIAISGPDLSRLGQLAGLERTPNVAFSVTGKVRHREGHLTVSDSRVNLGRLQIAASIDIPDLKQPTRANLEANASVPNIEVFRYLLDLPETFRGAVAMDILLDAKSADTTLAGSITSDYGRIEAEGLLGARQDLVGTTLDLRVTGDDISQLLDLAGLDQPTQGPWRMESNLSIAEDRVDLAAGKAFLDDIDVSGSFSATVPREAPLSNLSGELELSAPNPRKSITPWLGDDEQLLSLFPERPAEASLVARWSGDKLRLEELLLVLPEAQLRGDVTMTPDTGALEGRIKLLGANLSRHLPPIEFLQNIPAQQLDQPLALESDISVLPGALSIDNLDFQLGDLVANGRLALSDDLVDVDMDLSAENIYDWFGAGPRLTDGGALPASASIILSLTGDTLDITELDLKTGLGGTIKSSGELRFGESFSGTGLIIKADLPDMRRLGLLAGVPLPPIPLIIDMALDGDETRLTATKLRVVSVDSEFGGNLEIRNPQHPEIQLALTAPLLDLRPFYSPPEPASPSADETEPPAAPKKKRDKHARLIPAKPIDFSPLAAFDADFSLEADRIVGHTRRFKDMVLMGKVSEGTLLVQRASGTDESGGKIEFSGFVVPSPKGHRIGLDVDGYDINLGFPARSPEEVDLLPRFNLMGEMFSTGDDLKTLAAGLNAALQVTAGEGRVSSMASGMLTNSFIDELLSLVNPLREEENYTDVSCLTLLAEVKNGKLKGDPLATLVTKKLAVVSKAQIDLTNEKLFLTFNTIPQRGLGISASSAFKPFVGVAGTLAKPQLTLDPEGTLIQGSLAVATGGISLIGKSVLDRFTVSKKSCAKAEKSFIDEHEDAEAEYLAFRKAVLPPGLE